jgi:hypothetical protein
MAMRHGNRQMSPSESLPDKRNKYNNRAIFLSLLFQGVDFQRNILLRLLKRESTLSQMVALPHVSCSAIKSKRRELAWEDSTHLLKV